MGKHGFFGKFMLTNVAKNSVSVWNLGSNSCFPKIITISTDLAISSSMSSFVPKLWLKWQILVAIFYEFRKQRWDH